MGYFSANPNFYPNSHLDVSKDFLLTGQDISHSDDIEYFKILAERIRKNWKVFAEREV